MKNISAIFACLFIGILGFAQNDEVIEMDALKKTQELLNNPSTRGGAMIDQNSLNADKAAKTLGDKSGQTDNIYSLSNDVFESMLKENNGDSDKVQKLLQEGMRNPADFASKMSPEQQKKLKEISEKIEGPKARP